MVQRTKTGKNKQNIPKGHLINQMQVKHTKLPQNIPKGHLIYKM
jgi:hypothetical protein